MNKRLLILFICMAIVVVTVVVCAVTFTVRTIEVLAPIESENSIDKAKIVIDSNIKLGSSVFALSEKKAKENIEVNNPYLKVVTIERVFPSSIHINIIPRVAIIAIPLDDGVNYMLIDREMKMLEIRERTKTPQDMTIISGYNLVGVTQDMVGQTLLAEGKIGNIRDTILAIENVGLVNEFAKVFAKSIDFGHENFVVVNTRKGLNLAIRINSNIDIKSQFLSLFSVFETSEFREDSTKYIYLTNNGISPPTTNLPK